jgi:hypothetical protein
MTVKKTFPTNFKMTFYDLKLRLFLLPLPPVTHSSWYIICFKPQKRRQPEASESGGDGDGGGDGAKGKAKPVKGKKGKKFLEVHNNMYSQ